MDSPIIYNLFPLLAGDMSRWAAHAARAAEMGFNWIYINPIQYPGFSGSLYAVKDYYRLNPLFIPPGTSDPMAELRRTLDQIHGLGLKVMMDLVINHTARDSELVESHPSWYRRDKKGKVISPSAIDPDNAKNVTVWGDLAEIDNESSADRQGLWDYWAEMVRFNVGLGVDGFRCDAAYKVPAALWRYLIGAAREQSPDLLFAAETLGCRLSEVRRLNGVGFDYLFNSSKYWNFDASWALEQHEELGELAPSIAFPESHDTPRLMQETGGLLQVQKQRYVIAAAFSAGLLMPIGYELGFRRRVNVVKTRPEHWEETGIDLQPFIQRTNRLKRELAILGGEGRWKLLSTLDGPVVVLRRLSRPGGGRQAAAPSADGGSILMIVNKDWRKPQEARLPHHRPAGPAASASASAVEGTAAARSGATSWPRRLLRLCRDEAEGELPPESHLLLEPAEVVLVIE